MKQLHYLIAAFMLVLLTGCPFGAPDAIELGYKQSSSITLNHDEASSSIEFVADADWYVTISPVNAKPTSWIHFDNTTGSAGANTLTFSIEKNLDSESRAANIIISCLDASVSVLVTQLSENESSDDNEDDENQGVQSMKVIDIRQWNCSYANGLMMNENDTRIKFIYNPSEPTIPCEILSETHLRKDDNTPPTQTAWKFYDYKNGKIRAESVTSEVWGSTIYNETQHEITLQNGLATSGWFKTSTQTNAFEYNLYYDLYNHLAESSRGGKFQWKNGNMTSASIKGYHFTFTYHPEYINNRKIDINWLIVSHSELSVALGDDSRIWAMTRQLGSCSKNLVQEFTTPTSRFVVEYDKFTEHIISCTVYEYQGDELVGETQYTIR